MSKDYRQFLFCRALFSVRLPIFPTEYAKLVKSFSLKSLNPGESCHGDGGCQLRVTLFILTLSVSPLSPLTRSAPAHAPLYTRVRATLGASLTTLRFTSVTAGPGERPGFDGFFIILKHWPLQNWETINESLFLFWLFIFITPL